MRRTARVRAATTAAAVALLASLAGAPVSQATVQDRTALLENGTFSEFDQTNAQAAQLTNTGERAYQGSRSAAAVYDANGENGFSRGVFNTHWAQGDDVYYGEAVYLPRSFMSDMQGEVDLMRWDNWDLDPTHTDRCGVVMFDSDKRAHFQCWRLGVNGSTTAQLGPFKIPVGRWTWIEVHQHLSSRNGHATSTVWENGRRIGTTHEANYFGRPVTNIRFGIVAEAGSAQRKKLSLNFDRVELSRNYISPK